MTFTAFLFVSCILLFLFALACGVLTGTLWCKREHSKSFLGLLLLLQGLYAVNLGPIANIVAQVMMQEKLRGMALASACLLKFSFVIIALSALGTISKLIWVVGGWCKHGCACSCPSCASGSKGEGSSCEVKSSQAPKKDL